MPIDYSLLIQGFVRDFTGNLPALQSLIDGAREALRTRMVVTRSVLGQSVTIDPEAAAENLAIYEGAYLQITAAVGGPAPDPTVIGGSVLGQTAPTGHGFNFGNSPLRT